MNKELWKKDNEKTTNNTLGISDKTDSSTFSDLTNNDGNEDPGAELDTIINYSKKNKLEKTHPKPQADEALNPGLNSQNDI